MLYIKMSADYISNLSSGYNRTYYILKVFTILIVGEGEY